MHPGKEQFTLLYNKSFFFLSGIGISLTHNNESLAIINIYCHPNQFTPFSTFDRFLQFLRYNFKNIIITGDINVYYPW